MLVRILLVAFFVVGISDSKKHNRDNEPEFVKNLNNSQRSSFFGIVKNPGFSFQQKEEKLVKWAEANNLTSQYAEFSKNQTEHKAELSKKISGVIDRLAAAKVEVDAINADLSLTKIQRDDKINELKKTYPQEIPTLFFIGGYIENPGKHQKVGSECEGKERRHKHRSE